MWRVWTRFIVERPAVLSGRRAVVSHSVLHQNLLQPSFKPSIWSNRCLSISSITADMYADVAQDKAQEAKNSKDSEKIFSYDFLNFDNFLTQPGDSRPFNRSTRTGQRTMQRKRRPLPRMGEIYSKEILLLDFQRICDLGTCILSCIYIRSNLRGGWIAFI